MWFLLGGAVSSWAIAAALLLKFPFMQRTRRTLALTSMAVLSPVFAFTLWLDKAFKLSSRTLPWPRSREDVLTNPQQLFVLMKEGPKQRIPANAQLVSLRESGGIDSEPDKGKTAMKFSVVYEVPGASGAATQHTTNIFLKLTSERGVKFELQVITCVFANEIRELGMYRRLESGELTLPLRVPPMYFQGWSRAFHRSVLVLELLPGEWSTVPDWKGMSLAQAHSIMDNIGRMHAQYWRCSADLFKQGRDVSFLYFGPGLAWLGFIELWLKPGVAPPWAVTLWSALRKHYDADPRMTWCHGDCRPGNLLFRNGGATAADVVFTDWEATAITPFMWDFMYNTVAGLPVDVRRSTHTELLDHYRRVLVQNGVPAEDCALDRCELDFGLLSIVLQFYGWGLVRAQGVGTDVQGNTANDVACWSERVFAAMSDVQPQAALVAKTLGVSDDVLAQAFVQNNWGF